MVFYMKNIQQTSTIMEKQLDLVYAEALSQTLDEWGSKNDEEAYRDL